MTGMNNDRSGGSDLVSLISWIVIGAVTGHLLAKYPAARVVAALVVGLFGWAFIAADGGAGVVAGLVCFAISAALIFWAFQPVRAREAASARFAALQTPEDVSRMMVGQPVRSGPLVGWKIQVAHVVPNTFRTAEGNAWADVDIILSNGDAVPATFHADTAADTWEWGNR